MTDRSDAHLARSDDLLVFWEEGIGDDKKYHIAHVSSLGLTFVRSLKDYAKYQQLVHHANEMPANAVQLLQADPKAEVHALPALGRVTFAEQLNQLYLFDKRGKRTVIPDGKGDPQAKIFTALKRFGGSISEEEADAWSVLKTPLYALAFVAAIGGFFIWFTTICEPDFTATGRRSGMKQLLNSIGLAIGPFWASVIVAVFALPMVGLAIYLLVKRPVRQVLSF